MPTEEKKKRESTPRVAGTASYDPRFLELWNKAAEEDVELPVPDREAGIALRHRLYRLRMAMQRENHRWYLNAAKCSIPNPYQREGQWYLRIQNSDKKYEDSLSKAGFGVPPPPPILD